MATVDPKKTQTIEKDRMHFRLDPKIKARVARAAAITGQGLTDFAVSTLREKTDQTSHSTTQCCSPAMNTVSS